jgi:hypothetical protein
MSFFDFIFPQEAQAAHLRQIAQVQTLQFQRQRLQELQKHRAEMAQNGQLEARIEEIECDVGQIALAFEALLELLEESGALTREKLSSRVREIDARDGVADGKLSPPKKEPFVPKRRWQGPREGGPNLSSPH